MTNSLRDQIVGLTEEYYNRLNSALGPNDKIITMYYNSELYRLSFGIIQHVNPNTEMEYTFADTRFTDLAKQVDEMLSTKGDDQIMSFCMYFQSIMADCVMHHPERSDILRNMLFVFCHDSTYHWVDGRYIATVDIIHNEDMTPDGFDIGISTHPEHGSYILSYRYQGDPDMVKNVMKIVGSLTASSMRNNDPDFQKTQRLQ